MFKLNEKNTENI